MLCYHKTLNSQSLKSQLSPFLSVKTFQVSRHSKFLFSYEYHAVRVFWQCIWGGKKYTNFHSFKTLWFCSSQSFLNTCITKRGVTSMLPLWKQIIFPVLCQSLIIFLPPSSSTISYIFHFSFLSILKSQITHSYKLSEVTGF